VKKVVHHHVHGAMVADSGSFHSRQPVPKFLQKYVFRIQVFEHLCRLPPLIDSTVTIAGVFE